ncbi:hypothetical protein PCAR4_360084 [Paraburkholderia caribensis]|nr:hypothetical protein PCAR4_360084 [Paraburkholderia caribensis]
MTQFDNSLRLATIGLPADVPRTDGMKGDNNDARLLHFHARQSRNVNAGLFGLRRGPGIFRPRQGPRQSERCCRRWSRPDPTRDLLHH